MDLGGSIAVMNKRSKYYMSQYIRNLLLTGEDGEEFYEHAVVMAFIAGIAVVPFLLKDKFVYVVDAITALLH